MSRTISFRGLIEDGGEDRIPLQTIQGLIGYKITKLQILPESPVTGAAGEHVVQIWKTTAPVISSDVDFSNNRLLAVAVWSGNKNPAANVPSPYESVIFDSEKFNQDIYITHVDADGNLKVNYYIELEQMKLDLNEQTVATLKDIRNTGTQ